MITLVEGDCLEVLDSLPRVKCIFADPPDNIGLGYADGQGDKLPLAHYYDWLELLIRKSMARCQVLWLSYYWQHDLEVKHRVRSILKYDYPSWQGKTVLWRYTFGQHRDADLGSGFRYILRLSSSVAKFHVSEIRVPSARQLSGDLRADPEGRVPDDVWDFPRVVGNAAERRLWHPTQHPQRLVERIVAMSCGQGEVFADLFEGSGTSIRACKNMKIDHVGIELSHTYVQALLAEHPDVKYVLFKGGLKS